MDEIVAAAEVDVVHVADSGEVEIVEVDVTVVEVTDDGTEDGTDDGAEEDLLLLEEAQDPLVLQVWEPTGEPRVDAALDRLAELDPDDVHQHAGIFDDIHQQLRATLTDLDATS